MTTAQRNRIVHLTATFIVAVAGVSAHVVRGVINPTLATAFVSSPSAGQDAPIKIMWGAVDSGLRVVCFNAANTSQPRPDDPDWPRITGVGFELPGTLSGFSLLEPLDGNWQLVEGIQADIPDEAAVPLDFAIVARVNPAGWSPTGPENPLGISPGQPAARGNGTRFCVGGHFPDTMPNPSVPNQQVPTTIEMILNGVVVSFHRVQPHGPSIDFGLWDSTLRTIPQYPE